MSRGKTIFLSLIVSLCSGTAMAVNLCQLDPNSCDKINELRTELEQSVGPIELSADELQQRVQQRQLQLEEQWQHLEQSNRENLQTYDIQLPSLNQLASTSLNDTDRRALSKQLIRLRRQLAQYETALLQQTDEISSELTPAAKQVLESELQQLLIDFRRAKNEISEKLKTNIKYEFQQYSQTSASQISLARASEWLNQKSSRQIPGWNYSLGIYKSGDDYMLPIAFKAYEHLNLGLSLPLSTAATSTWLGYANFHSKLWHRNRTELQLQSYRGVKTRNSVYLKIHQGWSLLNGYLAHQRGTISENYQFQSNSLLVSIHPVKTVSLSLGLSQNEYNYQPINARLFTINKHIQLQHKPDWLRRKSVQGIIDLIYFLPEQGHWQILDEKEIWQATQGSLDLAFSFNF